MANDYYTFKNGGLWRHHDEDVDRNTFYEDADGYDAFQPSSVEVVLNDFPSSIKDFHTLNYEGSQSKIDKFSEESIPTDGFQPDTTYVDQEVYNLYGKNGWHVEKIFTDKEEGYILQDVCIYNGKPFTKIKDRGKRSQMKDKKVLASVDELQEEGLAGS